MANNYSVMLDIGQGLSLMIGIPTISSWVVRPKRPRPGTVGFNLKTKRLEYFDGEAWYEAAMQALA